MGHNLGSLYQWKNEFSSACCLCDKQPCWVWSTHWLLLITNWSHLRSGQISKDKRLQRTSSVNDSVWISTDSFRDFFSQNLGRKNPDLPIDSRMMMTTKSTRLKVWLTRSQNFDTSDWKLKKFPRRKFAWVYSKLHSLLETDSWLPSVSLVKLYLTDKTLRSKNLLEGFK